MRHLINSILSMILLVVDGGTDAITEKIISHTNEAAHICAQPKKEN